MCASRNPLQLWNVPWSHPPHHLTLRGASVVVSGPGDDIALLHIFPTGMTETRLIRTGEPAVSLDISPSGRFILLRERRRTGSMILWDVEHDTQTLLPETIPAHGHMPTGWMTTLAGCEMLLLIPHRFALVAYDLAVMRPIFRVRTAYPYGFLLSHLMTIPSDPNTLFVMGHLEGEGRDTLLRLSLRDLQANPAAFLTAIRHRKHFYDYAYCVLVGPCPPDSVGLFRDPEEAEDPESYDDDELMADVAGFRGIYIRRLHDNRLVERIPYAGRVPSGTPLYATATQVLVVSPDHVDVVPRAHSGGMPHTLTGQAFALDPPHGRLARLMPDGQVAIFDLTTDI